MLRLGGSSRDTDIQDSPQLQRPISASNRKPKIASFGDSAIADDDDKDWEDESETGDSSINDDVDFTRVAFSTHPPTRQSLITLMLSSNDNSTQRLGHGVAQPISPLSIWREMVTVELSESLRENIQLQRKNSELFIKKDQELDTNLTRDQYW